MKKLLCLVFCILGTTIQAMELCIKKDLATRVEVFLTNLTRINTRTAPRELKEFINLSSEAREECLNELDSFTTKNQSLINWAYIEQERLLYVSLHKTLTLPPQKQLPTGKENLRLAQINRNHLATTTIKNSKSTAPSSGFLYMENIKAQRKVTFWQEAIQLLENETTKINSISDTNLIKKIQ